MFARSLLVVALLAPFALAPGAAAIDPCDLNVERNALGGRVLVDSYCTEGTPNARVWAWNDHVYVMWWDMGSDAWVAFGLQGGVGYDVWLPLTLEDCGENADEIAEDPSRGSPLLEEFL